MNSVSRFTTCVFVSILSCVAHATTTKVASIAELQSAIAAANPGDRIVVANGSYATHAPLKITRAGSATAPITIAAETVGGVELTGSDGFDFAKPAAYIVVEGFKLAYASGKTVIGAGTSHVRLTRNVFRCVGDNPYLTVTGDDAEVDHNEFRDKATLGNMISVTGTGSQVARHLWVHHNYFHDFANAKGNGAETIRFGLSGLSMSRGDGIVEYNLFVHCEGENELISNKSCGNTYRYNTLLDAPGAQLTIRHGNDCVVYGNYLRNTDGLRIFGDRHQVVGNVFESNKRGINLGNGDGEVADGAKLTSHDRPDGAVIAFNTFIDNGISYQMDGRKEGMGATHTTFAHNILQGGGPIAKLGGPNKDPIWTENLTWKTGEAGDLPAAGMKAMAAHFAAGKNTFAVEAGETPLPSKTGTYLAPAAVENGEPRDTVVARILTPADVGPNAK